MKAARESLFRDETFDAKGARVLAHGRVLSKKAFVPVCSGAKWGVSVRNGNMPRRAAMRDRGGDRL